MSFISLNTTVEPFDDVDVRRAVAAGVDREAIRLARGGAVTGPIATHILPPGVPGHDEAGGRDGFGLDFLASPSGDAGVAAGYLRRAGFRSGRYDGDGLLLMVGSSNGSEREVAEVAKASLERLGFEVRLPVVTQDVMLARFCAVPAADADMLVLRVVDDGVGGADPTGGGLSGLRDRVHAVDGELLVASAPGTGTAIEAGLPLSRAHELPTAAATA